MVWNAGTTLDIGFDGEMHGAFLFVSAVVALHTLWDVCALLLHSLRHRSLVARVVLSRGKSRLALHGLLWSLLWALDHTGLFVALDTRLWPQGDARKSRELCENVVFAFALWTALLHVHVSICAVAVAARARTWLALAADAESAEGAAYRRVQATLRARAAAPELRLDRFARSLAGAQLVALLDVPWVAVACVILVIWVAVAFVLFEWPQLLQLQQLRGDDFVMVVAWGLLVSLWLLHRLCFLRQRSAFLTDFVMGLVQAAMMCNTALVVVAVVVLGSFSSAAIVFATAVPLLATMFIALPQLCCDAPFCVACRGELPPSLLAALAKHKPA